MVTSPPVYEKEEFSAPQPQMYGEQPKKVITTKYMENELLALQQKIAGLETKLTSNFKAADDFTSSHPSIGESTIEKIQTLDSAASPKHEAPLPVRKIEMKKKLK